MPYNTPTPSEIHHYLSQHFVSEDLHEQMRQNRVVAVAEVKVRKVVRARQLWGLLPLVQDKLLQSLVNMVVAEARAATKGGVSCLW